MAYVARQSDFHVRTAAPAAPAAAPARRSLWRWLYDAVMLSRERQSQRDIDSLVARRDSRFTDSFEREIAERSYSDGWMFRR